MTKTRFKLKNDVIFEPLISRWYAWSYLIAPASAALFISEHYKPILESYIKSPKLHQNAAQSYNLQGGPFLNAQGEDKVSESVHLLSAMKKDCSTLFELSIFLKSINNLLVKNSTLGASLSGLYQDMDENFRGCIELTYDINHVSGFRIIEPFLYKTSAYKENIQSVNLSVSNVDKRPFMLNTPRFYNNFVLNIKKPFRDYIYDIIGKARSDSIDMDELTYLSDSVDKSKKAMLHDFFSVCENSRSKIAGLKNKVNFNIKYFGHACVLVECGEINILIDPLISYTVCSGPDRYTYDDLPDTIDYVIITHAHQDHFVLETLLQIRWKIGAIIVPKNSRGKLQDPSLKLVLMSCGFHRVYDLSELEEIEIPFGKIIGIPFFGEHADLDISKLGFSITYNKKTVLFMADSDNTNVFMYKILKEILGVIDMVFIGMECNGAPMSWLYSALIMQPINREINQSRRLNGLNSEKAFSLIETLNCKNVYVYAMGFEPWVNFISNISSDEDSIQMAEVNRLIRLCSDRRINVKRLWLKEDIIVCN